MFPPASRSQSLLAISAILLIPEAHITASVRPTCIYQRGHSFKHVFEYKASVRQFESKLAYLSQRCRRNFTQLLFVGRREVDSTLYLRKCSRHVPCIPGRLLCRLVYPPASLLARHIQISQLSYLLLHSPGCALNARSPLCTSILCAAPAGTPRLRPALGAARLPPGVSASCMLPWISTLSDCTSVMTADWGCNENRVICRSWHVFPLLWELLRAFSGYLASMGWFCCCCARPAGSLVRQQLLMEPLSCSPAAYNLIMVSQLPVRAMSEDLCSCSRAVVQLSHVLLRRPPTRGPGTQALFWAVRLIV